MNDITKKIDILFDELEKTDTYKDYISVKNQLENNKDNQVIPNNVIASLSGEKIKDSIIAQLHDKETKNITLQKLLRLSVGGVFVRQSTGL